MAAKLMTVHEPIPEETALQLCAAIHQQHQGKWWTLAGMQCFFCLKFSNGDPAKRCVSSRPDFRGCNLVTACFERSDR